MKIETIEKTVRELVSCYKDTGVDGSVFALGGRLNVRPAYQREYVYDDDKAAAVIKTILKGYPLNVFYWAVNEDGTYEMLDGQQRTISICRFIKNIGNQALSISRDGVGDVYKSLKREDRKQILKYPLQICICTGSDDDKMDWFETINTVGSLLTKQEMRNAVYNGTWISDARKWFGVAKCEAYEIGKDLIAGGKNVDKITPRSPERQFYLEKAIEWACGSKKESVIRGYMRDRRRLPNADELKEFFKSVVEWAKTVFPDVYKNENYKNDMKGVDWGKLYRNHGHKEINTMWNVKAFNKMNDPDVQVRSGIFEYVLTGQERWMNEDRFSEAIKRAVYRKQNRECFICKNQTTYLSMHGHHNVPWSKDGPTTEENCQMLCSTCNIARNNIGAVNNG